MCTLSIIAIRSGAPGAYRVVMNRDERDDRPDAQPPSLHRFEGTAALAPIDALARGTWIAVNDHALTFTLMNRTDDRSGSSPPPPARPLSRGLIIPSIAHHKTSAGAIAAARALDWFRYPPCRLTVFAPGELADAPPTTATFSWSGSALGESIFTSAPLCFASSGLGDHLVQSRLPLFEASMRPAPDPQAQTRFHQHRWPESPSTSVLMSRPAHRTVSITTVDVGEAITMTYAPVRRARRPETGDPNDDLIVGHPITLSLRRPT